MKTVIIALDEKTAAWVRVYAAKHNTSVSRMVGEMLQQRMREAHGYDEPMRRFLAKKPVWLKGTGHAVRDARRLALPLPSSLTPMCSCTRAMQAKRPSSHVPPPRWVWSWLY